MPILDDKVISEVKKQLAPMTKPVTLKFFSQDFECMYCKETHQLLEELLSTNPLLKLETYKFESDEAVVKEYGIEQIPAIAVVGEEDYGIRFYGIPSGYEFTSLLNAILMVSTGIAKLLPETKAWLDNLKEDIHLKVLVTPTCPYCPPAVMLAQRLAMYSKRVKAEMIEVSEFPHLAQKYAVQGVPRTVINEKDFLEGSAPEKMLLEKLQSVIRG